MAIWTMSIHEILENYALPNTNLSPDDLIDQTYMFIFDFAFPWYSSNETGKIDFQKLFLLDNLMNEIGFETLQMFKAALEAKLKRVMPYYQQVWESTQLSLSWDENVNMSYSDSGNETRNASRNSNGSVSNTVNTESIDSDNPQVTVQTNDYASGMNRGQSIGIGTSNDRVTDNESTKRNSVRKEWGAHGMNKGEIVKAMRDVAISINKEIIDECKDLFMGVW